MKKTVLLIVSCIATIFAIISCGGSSEEKSAYEFTDSILKYKDEPVLVATKVTESTQMMELTSGGVTFEEERPILRVTFRLLKKIDTKVIYANAAFDGIDQDDSKVKNASWACYDYTQQEKLAKLMNGNVGDTLTIKFANLKRERLVDFHMDQVKKLSFDFFSPYTQEDSDEYNEKYGLSEKEDDTAPQDE